MEDLNRFKQTFFEESAELLAVAEAGLLRLGPGQSDDDEINAIFRAVHSIKGGAGAFGFAELVAFAHVFETVMDKVRNHTLPVTVALVDRLIRANDVLGRMLAHARDEQPVPAGTGAEIQAELATIATGKSAKVGDDPSPVPGPGGDDDGFGIYPEALADIESAREEIAAETARAFAETPAEAGRIRWVVTFEPKTDLLLSGNEPSYMFRALARLGDARVVCHSERLPAWEDIEPETLYLTWTIVLITDLSVDRAQIEDVFEFVVDECAITITLDPTAVIVPADPPPTASRAPSPTTPAATTGTAVATGDTPPPPAARPEPPPPAARPEPPPPAVAPPLVPTPTVSTAPANTALAGPSAATPPGSARDADPHPRPRSESAPAGLVNHTIRVDLDKIDRLVNMVGEMVITQAMVSEHVRDLPPGRFQTLQEGLEQLAQYTRELQESVMSIRAQPVSSVFSRMPRLVRDLAAETGKEVQLVTSGEMTEVDKTVVENLVDPLTHMIRNSVDHGIERPETRLAAGKPRTGTVHLSAQHRSGRIVIEVADDGQGIDRRRVLDKAMEKGLVPAGASLSDDEIDDLIFLPGFSTADAVSNISGRGVGMDVVRRNITSLGGRIGIYSQPGRGSRFVLSLPLTLAVLDGMVISVGPERFVLPLTNIVESLRPRAADLHGLVNQCDVIMARGEYVRLVYLHRLFGIPDAEADPTHGLVILVETEDGSRIGLVVDEVLGQQQVVIKSLEANFRRIDGVAAATILGDGRVALILDVAGLREMSRVTDGRTLPVSLPTAAIQASLA